MAQSKEERIRSANDEVVGRGNLEVVDEVFAADYTLHTGGKDYRGPAFVKKFIGQLRAAIPDLRVVSIEILMEAGDTVAWRRTLGGTHKVDMMGIPASGQKVEWSDMLVTRFEGGKIVEEWAVSDLAGQLFSRLPHA